MCLRLFHFLLGLTPVVLAACAEVEPAPGSPIPTAPLVGVDLGGSGRVPQIAALAGEGEGYGRTEPNPSPTDPGSMPGMAYGAMSGMSQGAMDHGAIPGMSDGRMGHDAMPGMSHGQMDHTSMPRMRHQMASPMSGMRHGSVAGDMQMAHSDHSHIQGTGAVNSVDLATHKINVSHRAIPTIGWPAMTMDFAVAPSVDLQTVKPGTRVRFEMERDQGGNYVIQSIAPAGGGRK